MPGALERAHERISLAGGVEGLGREAPEILCFMLEKTARQECPLHYIQILPFTEKHASMRQRLLKLGVYV